MNQGSFVLGKIQQMSDAEVDSLVKEVTKLYVEAAAGISRIVAERDANNESANDLPPVLPSVRMFGNIANACWLAGLPPTLISLSRSIKNSLLPIIPNPNFNQHWMPAMIRRHLKKLGRL